MLSKFMENDINILDVFHCPHLSDLNCSCRKPKPGMFFDAQNKHNINMKESWMIGDSERDISAANSAGIKHTILVRSGHKINEGNSSAMFFLDSINQANQFILK
jgi:D-glycero-D-manno-heptose 1,7-bisphosphate phosphatase